MIKICEHAEVESVGCDKCGKEARVYPLEPSKKLCGLIEKVLRDCHSKISLYNEASQKYLGGIEATRLLSNIEETINILQDKKEGK